MNDSLFGILIRNLRTKRNITADQLSRGLCSSSLLYMIERGKRDSDRLLVNTFWQKLGRSPERFSMILNQDENELWLVAPKKISPDFRKIRL